jgi:uncharacterized protein DUF3226
MNNPSNVLLVEGMDDLHVIASLLQSHAFPEVFEIAPKDGIERLLQVLPVQLKASGITSVGAVIDADFDIEARWNSVRHVLGTAGYNCPGQAGHCRHDLGRGRQASCRRLDYA